jgi:hypothetical protein
MLLVKTACDNRYDTKITTNVVTAREALYIPAMPAKSEGVCPQNRTVNMNIFISFEKYLS